MNVRLKAEACRYLDRRPGPAFGRMTSGPAPNVQSRCGIGGASVPATDALELVPVGTVAPIDTAASRTALRGVFRINRLHVDASQRCLVGQKGAKLSECPAVVRASLRPSKRCPFTDALEVFKSNPAPGVFGLPHHVLTDPVVEVGGEAPLLRLRRLNSRLADLVPFFWRLRRSRACRRRRPAFNAPHKLSPLLSAAMLRCPRSTPRYSAGSPAGTSATSIVTERKNIPLRCVRAACRRARSNRACW